MGIFENLDKLRDLYLSGKLTDEEYEAGRFTIVTGRPEVVDELLKGYEDRKNLNED